MSRFDSVGNYTPDTQDRLFVKYAHLPFLYSLLENQRGKIRLANDRRLMPLLTPNLRRHVQQRNKEMLARSNQRDIREELASLSPHREAGDIMGEWASDLISVLPGVLEDGEILAADELYFKQLGHNHLRARTWAPKRGRPVVDFDLLSASSQHVTHDKWLCNGIEDLYRDSDEWREEIIKGWFPTRTLAQQHWRKMQSPKERGNKRSAAMLDSSDRRTSNEMAYWNQYDAAMAASSEDDPDDSQTGKTCAKPNGDSDDAYYAMYDNVIPDLENDDLLLQATAAISGNTADDNSGRNASDKNGDGPNPKQEQDPGRNGSATGSITDPEKALNQHINGMMLSLGELCQSNGMSPAKFQSLVNSSVTSALSKWQV